IKVSKIIGVACQEEFFTIDPLPVGGKRTGAAEQLWLEERADCRRLSTRGNVVTYHIRQVVKVDEDLVDTRAAERVEPDVKQGPVIDNHHALRDSIGNRPQAAADSSGEQEGLHVPALRTTPRARIRALASASTPSRPSMLSSHAAYAATDSTGVCRG